VLRGYLELLRPANVVTAIADVLAGYAVAGRTHPRGLPWLVGATMCLYAGGVVLNDFFDRRLDAVERPERPIPSGRVSATSAAATGSTLLVVGVVAASQASREGFLVAAAIAAFVLLYDARTKRHPVAGPINMGLCRGLNLLLGVSAVPGAVWDRWPIGLFAVVYIAAVTAVSRGEVHGGRTVVATLALISLGGVVLGLLVLVAGATAGRIAGIVLVAALDYLVFPP
jgi:4-hydroxybenzoate polyprenyltransferase